MRGGRSGRRPASAIPFTAHEASCGRRSPSEASRRPPTSRSAPCSASSRSDDPGADAGRRRPAADHRAGRPAADRLRRSRSAICSRRIERRRVERGVRGRVPDPPSAARRQPAQPRAALARLARRLDGALYALVALPFVGWVGSVPRVLRLGRGARAADLPALGPGGRRRRDHLRPRTSATSRRRRSTSPRAPVRCTPRRGSLAASPRCRSRWRGCCSSRASASA